MRVLWLNCGLHLEPHTQAEADGLEHLRKALICLGVPQSDRVLADMRGFLNWEGKCPADYTALIEGEHLYVEAEKGKVDA